MTIPNLDPKEFPPNPIRTLSSKETPPPEVEAEKKVKKVISGAVKKKKRSFIDGFSETFFGDTAANVGSYIIWDVLIPAAKNTISEMVSTGIEMLLFGENRAPSGIRRDKGRSVVSYGSFFDRERSDRRDTVRNRSRHQFDDIIIETRSEAEEVLDGLAELIDNFGQASVSDLYDMLGMESDYSDNKYGWVNLARANTNRVRGGYVLVLPSPKLLE